jgi:hypothetical protein
MQHNPFPQKQKSNKLIPLLVSTKPNQNQTKVCIDEVYHIKLDVYLDVCMYAYLIEYMATINLEERKKKKRKKLKREIRNQFNRKKELQTNKPIN